MVDVETLHLALGLAHAAAGVVGIVLLWFPIFSTKGSRLHIVTGRAFVSCVLFSAVTGLIACAWALLDGPSYFGDPELSRVRPGELPRLLEEARFQFSLLTVLSLMILATTVFGVRVVRLRGDHARLRHPATVALHAAYGAGSLGLLAYGCLIAIGATGPAGRAWMPIVLGLVGLMGAWEDFRYMNSPPASPMAWRYKHIESMLGVGIAYTTAFLIFGVNHFFGDTRLGALSAQGQAAPWLLPLLVGVPAILIWIRREERRFEESEDDDGSEEHGTTGSGRASAPPGT